MPDQPMRAADSTSPQRESHAHRMRTLWNAASVGLLLLLTTANLFWGSIDLPAGEVWQALTGNDTTSAPAFIVLQSRLPALLTAAMAGAALAVAGLLLQTIFSNPLADPSILGVNSGAGLGVAIAMLLLGGTFTAGELTLSGFLLTVVAAFIGAAVVIVLLLIFSRRMPGTLTLLIAGVMISFITSSLISLLSFYATAQGVQSFMIWGLGNFSGVTLERLSLFATGDKRSGQPDHRIAAHGTSDGCCHSSMRPYLIHRTGRASCRAPHIAHERPPPPFTCHHDLGSQRGVALQCREFATWRPRHTTPQYAHAAARCPDGVLSADEKEVMCE